MSLENFKQNKKLNLDHIKLVNNILNIKGKKGNFYSFYHPDLIYIKNKSFLSKEALKKTVI